MLDHQCDSLVVDQAAVLDRIDPGDHGVLDPLGPVCVRGHLAAGGVGLLDGRTQFLDRELRCSGRIAPREHAPRCVDLDHVHPVLELGTNHVTDLVDAVGDLVVAFLGEHRHADLGRVVVQVTVPARDRNPRSAGHDPRARDETLVDRRAQVDRQERPAADVADRGEARVERDLRVLHRGEGALKRRVLEFGDLFIAVGARADVGVGVDQPRQHGRLREIDHGRAFGLLHLAGRTDGRDSITLDDDHLVGAQGVARAVEEPAGLDHKRL